ncbi:MAG TPA: TA system VapC family ribonuclease toxin [Terriglobales bacterium]|nr:TA system VapC family ribonuclease toxin [Terriglobales bacterium]
MTPDVNLLVAAFRQGHVHHASARRWLGGALAECARGETSLGLLPVAIVSFLRLVTNSRVFADPDTIADGVAFVDAMLASPGVALLGGAEWPLLRQKLLTLDLSGNEITDAWIAALTEAHGESLVTYDRDFRRLLAPRDLTLLQPPS